MTRGAVTFDFHDTLARCDRWFELEVRDLAPAYLRWRAERNGERVDPVLLDEAAVAYRRLRLQIIEHGRELTAEACVARVLVELGRPADEDDIARGVERLMRDRLAEVEPVPGAIALVEALRAAGVPLGIVSSAVYHPFLDWTLTRFGLRDAFGVVTTSASAGFYKSRPEIFWQTLEALGAPAALSIHVGDSHRFDVEGARRAGMRTVWLKSSATEEPPGEPADLTVGGLEGLAPRLLGLLAAREVKGER